MAGMARMGRRRTSQGEKGELRRNHGSTELRNHGCAALNKKILLLKNQIFQIIDKITANPLWGWLFLLSLWGEYREKVLTIRSVLMGYGNFTPMCLC